MDDKKRLTHMASKSGWAAKMAPSDLAEMMKALKPIQDSKVLVGTETADDAAVYQLDENTALVQTLDFFTPVVDDPYIYGLIAAANSLSDVYAMGAKPILAMNIVAFPCEVENRILGQIIKGGQDKASEAGIEIVGGHSVTDDEPKYGLAVTGIVNPREIIFNSTAKPGDKIILTKPLGFGILATGLKGNQFSEKDIEKEISTAARLNKTASEAMMEVGINACTDVTGFGLIGHLQEMALASGLSAEILVENVPYWPKSLELATKGFVPGGAKSNRDYIGQELINKNNIDPVMMDILFDPQTSGGLLISLSEDKVIELKNKLKENGELAWEVIGHFQEGPPGRIFI